jgi:exodeoxyribonuclease V alpha subunit
MNLDDSQLAAVEACNQDGDRVVTGGAGTGKTTLIKAIADQHGGRVILACPTGKAAARLREATGYNAKTIHSELLWDGTAFRRQGKIGIPVIIDEASMVESWLMAKLISFEPPKLILVGDASQLAPVGRGQPFHDLCALRPDIVSTLTICHRAKGAVHIAASAIRQGHAPEKRLESGGESWTIKETGDASRTMQQIETWIRAGMYDPTKDIIISPQYGSQESSNEQLLQSEPDGGIYSINRMVKSILNPAQDGETFTPGDRVICLKNFGEADLWNGDIGTVKAVDTKGNPFVLLDRHAAKDIDLEDDEEKAIPLTKEQTKQIAHAYALSVHKAQGSQFRRVFFVVFKRHSRMLSRSLIYTAVTRAREGCVVMGQTSAFYSGLNMQQTRRTVFQFLAEQQGRPQ